MCRSDGFFYFTLQNLRLRGFARTSGIGRSISAGLHQQNEKKKKKKKKRTRLNVASFYV